MKSTSIDELVFEPKDTEIFKIPDTKTRIGTVQNYFFPRLEILLKYTCSLIQQIYGVNPYERMTFVYKPSNRKVSRQSYDFDEVHIGLSGKRRTDRPLMINRQDGTPFFFHSTYLTYNIDLRGTLRVQLLPFRQNVDSQFVELVSKIVNDNIDALTTIFMHWHISYSSSEFLHLKDVFTYEEHRDYGIFLFSPYHWFPVKVGRSLQTLIITFAALYPLLDTFISIGENKPYNLAAMLEQFKSWCLTGMEGIVATQKENDNESAVIIPELDSYSFVRPGLWWTVLARDNWKCCSCGRSSQEDGITLEVDHIMPRSKGGTNDIENLQALCKKCNIGKSNRDDTDLRQLNKKAT